MQGRERGARNASDATGRTPEVEELVLRSPGPFCPISPVRAEAAMKDCVAPGESEPGNLVQQATLNDRPQELFCEAPDGFLIIPEECAHS
jgi:hypothetical protein